MDDADAAQQRHGDGHLGLGDGVHGGADEGDVEGDIARQARLEAGFGRQEIGVLGDQRNIVVSQSRVTELLHEMVQIRVDHGR